MKFAKAFLGALIGSIIANLVILYTLGSLVINPAMPLHALSVGPIVLLTTVGIIGATIVYALVRRFSARPNRMFFITAVIVLVLSFIPDLLIIGQTTGPFAGGTLPAALVLMCMHVAAAVITVWSLTRLWGPRVIPQVKNAKGSPL